MKKNQQKLYDFRKQAAKMARDRMPLSRIIRLSGEAMAILDESDYKQLCLDISNIILLHYKHDTSIPLMGKIS